jgi:hypothetical protein
MVFRVSLFIFVFLMNILGLQEESEISCHHEPSTQVIWHPKYCSTAAVLLSRFGISNCFGGCKEEEGWKTSHMVDPHKLFSGVFTDLREIINYNPDGEDPILTIFNYVDAMRCQLWEIAFFIDLGGDNGAHNNNPLEKQHFFFQADYRVLYMYFLNYLDIESHDSMFTIGFCQGSLYSLIWDFFGILR